MNRAQIHKIQILKQSNFFMTIVQQNMGNETNDDGDVEETGEHDTEVLNVS